MPIILKDASGAPLKNPFVPPGRGDGIIRYPSAYPPEFFIQKGQEAAIITNSPLPGQDVVWGPQYEDLIKFRQRGAWDVQRMASGNVDSKYVDYGTVAMGLYGAAAGIPTNTLLAIENSYSKRNSRFIGVPMSAEYPYLPRRNVYNTELGYKLFPSWKPK